MQLIGITRIARWDSYRMTGWDRSEERSVERDLRRGDVRPWQGYGRDRPSRRKLLFLRRRDRLVPPVPHEGVGVEIRSDP